MKQTYTITYQQIYLMQQINIYNIWQNKIKTNDLLHYIDYTCTNIITIDPCCVKCKGWTNYTSNLSSTYVFEEFLGQCNHSNHSLLLQQKGLISFQLIRENNLSEFGRMWQNSILVFIWPVVATCCLSG